MNQIPAFAILINRDYGKDRDVTVVIGVTANQKTAEKIMHDSFAIARNAFVDCMRNSGDIAYTIKDGQQIEDFKVLENEKYCRISMYQHDEIAPDCVSVSVYIEDTILYAEKPAHLSHPGHLDVDPVTGIVYLQGKWNFPEEGFTLTGKMQNMQGGWIQFWKNEETNNVGISLEDSAHVPDRIFLNRADGNCWFRQYIKPMHGNNIVRVD